MRASFVSAVAAGFVVALGATAPARAESAMAACGAQWQQAKAAGTTGGATWPEFLKQCRAQGATAAAPAPTPAPAAAPSQSGGSLFPWLNPQPAPSAGAASSNKEAMAACGEQWKQAKAAGTTGGASWPQFLSQCRARMAGGTTATAAPAPAPAPAPKPAPAQSGSLFPWMNGASQSAAPTAAGQFSTEAEARYRCPTDKVVWINTDSRIYHYQGSRYYAHTKKGAYMCEADASASGARASRSRQEMQQKAM